MNKKKKKKRSFISISTVSIVMTFLFMYVIVSWFQVWKNKIEISDALKSVNNKIDFLKSIPYEQQVITLIVTVIIFVLMLVLLRGGGKNKGYEDANWHGVHGDSRFYEPEEMREKGFASKAKLSKFKLSDPFTALKAQEGIILGLEQDSDQMLIIPHDTKLDNRNLLLVGSSGSSKGQAFIINNIINQKSTSIVVTDPKGELFNLTNEIKRDQGYNVLQIDFMNLVGNAFNPLEYVMDDLDAKRLAYTIARNSSKDDKEDHWFVKAADLLTGLIIYVKETYPNPSIPIEVKREFGRITESEDYLPELVLDLGEEHPAYLYLKEAAVAKGNERASIFSTFTKQTGIFNSIKVRSMTTHNSFHFNVLQEQPTILYVKVPIKDNPVASLTATFFDQLIGFLYKYGDANNSRLDIPTMLLLDEFANIGKINGYDEVLQTCRGYLLSLITVVQDFAQLEAKYGKELYRTIINGHATKVFLKTNDVETAKYFETLAGATTVKFSTKSSSSGGGLAYYLDLTKSSNGGTNQSEHYQKKNLLDHQELMKMDNEIMYAFIDGKPVALEKAFQHKIFNGLLTKEEKDANGVSKYLYIYPQNRNNYISKFGLKPYVEEKNSSNNVNEVEIVQEEIQLTPESDFISEGIEINSKNEILGNLIDEFLKEKQTKAPTNQNIEDKQSTEKNVVQENEKTFAETVNKIVSEANVVISNTFEMGSYAEVKERKNVDELKETLLAVDTVVLEKTGLEQLRMLLSETNVPNKHDETAASEATASETPSEDVEDVDREGIEIIELDEFPGL